MVTESLLDTNVLSAMRAPERQPKEFQRWCLDSDIKHHWISSVTLMEIESGVLKARRLQTAHYTALSVWLSRVKVCYASRVLNFEPRAASVAAELLQLRTRGLADLQIAAIAAANRLPLLTRNVADFEGIPGLEVINPWDGSPDV